MTWLIRILLLLYGLALIGGGIMGYVKAQSQESLIAGGASGLVALVAFAVSIRRPKLGFAIGFATAAAVGYFFMEKYLGAAEPAGEEISAEKTAVEKEIKRKLELPTEIGFEEGVPLPEALRMLQAVSGVTFVLNKEGVEAAANKRVKLERRELPLRNVLELVLKSAGDDFSYAIKEGAVVVGPKTSLKETLHLKKRAQMIAFTSLGMVIVLLIGLLLPSRRPPP